MPGLFQPGIISWASFLCLAQWDQQAGLWRLCWQILNVLRLGLTEGGLFPLLSFSPCCFIYLTERLELLPFLSYASKYWLKGKTQSVITQLTEATKIVQASPRSLCNVPSGVEKETNKIQACLGDTHGISLNLVETNEHLLGRYLMLEGTREGEWTTVTVIPSALFGSKKGNWGIAAWARQPTLRKTSFWRTRQSKKQHTFHLINVKTSVQIFG